MQFRGERRCLLRAAMAVAAAGMLPPARACEYVLDTLRVTHPWSRATELGAHSAVLGMTIDDVRQADRLIEVRTPIADGAELAAAPGQPLDLWFLPGTTVELSETGRHVRLVGLKRQLHTARDYPLELVFEKGGVVSTRLTVDQIALPTFRFR